MARQTNLKELLKWFIYDKFGLGISAFIVLDVCFISVLFFKLKSQELGAQGLINLIGYSLGALAFVVGFWQYHTDQKWKKIEFAIDLMDKFESKFLFKHAKDMLEYENKLIELNDKNIISVDNEMLRKALEKDTGLNDIDVYIRDCFDEFFDDLEQLNLFIEKGFLSPEELRIFLPYWLKLLANKGIVKKPDNTILSIWAFIERHHRGVKNLCERYGYDAPELSRRY